MAYQSLKRMIREEVDIGRVVGWVAAHLRSIAATRVGALHLGSIIPTSEKSPRCRCTVEKNLKNMPRADSTAVQKWIRFGWISGWGEEYL